MKKVSRTTPVIDKGKIDKGKPPSGSSRSAPSAGSMRESKSDNSNLTGQQKTALQGKVDNSSMGKSYLSKSHENLTAHQKKKLTAFDHRPKSSLGLPKTEPWSRRTGNNKENVMVKDKQTPLKSRPLKPPMNSPVPIRKASSTHSIDKTGGHTPFKVPSSTKMSMKRAHSTHNISKDKSMRKRVSAPTDVMAYNAELLANFEKEKKNWEAKISEQIQVAESRKAEIEKCKYEIKNLKAQVPSHNVKEEIELLRNQCKSLQEKLIELGYPVDQQITDTEKISLLNNKKGSSVSNSGDKLDIGRESQMRASASCDSLSTDGARGRAVSMPSSIQGMQGMKRASSVTMSEPGISFGDICGTPEHPSLLSLEMGTNWEKGSNKSSDALSEISVVGLTERILQMEETHYSTNEELQATLQELGDLQDTVNELTEENERLADEKAVLLESLCAQTVKLEHCRTQIEQLKCLLISGDLPNKSDRDQHLMELLKSAQEEREELICKQMEYANALQTSLSESRENQDEVDALKDKIKLQEDMCNRLKSEKASWEIQVKDLKEALASEQIEVNHYKTLLDNEKSKVQELEQLCKSEEKSDLEELLHSTLREKDKLEVKLADTQETLAHSQNEVSKLKEILSSRDEEIKVCRNNANSSVNKLEQVEVARLELQAENEVLKEHIDQLEQDCEGYLEEQKSYTSKMRELQDEEESLKQQKLSIEAELIELKRKYDEEVEEWKSFQKDLQVAVVIANDMRSESQEDIEKLRMDSASWKDKCISLEDQVRRLKEELDSAKIQEKAAAFNSPKATIMSSAELKGKVLNTVDRELFHLREGRRHESKNQTLSVKSLIQSIEEQVKSGCSSFHSSSCSSRRNSDSESSLAGIRDFHEMMKSPSSPVSDTQSLMSPEGPAPLRSALKRSTERPSPLQRHSIAAIPYDGPKSPDTPKSAPPPISRNDTPPSITSILSTRTTTRRSSGVGAEPSSERKEGASKDPLAGLAKMMKGSKRNALLKWCQQKTVAYSGVDITNFSSSWNDGLAFCALLHSYIGDKIPWTELNSDTKRRNFTVAFKAAESIGIPSILNINDMVAMERPDWQAVFSYVTSIYKHFEVDNKTP